jgi:hypothetical protein
MADTKLRYTAPNIPTRTTSSPSFYTTPQPHGLLSNSSFDHLTMFTKTTSLISASRSRQPTDSSFASSLTSFELKSVKHVRVSGLQKRFQRAQLHHFRPPIQDRREGSSLPRVQAWVDTEKLDKPAMGKEPIVFSLQDSASHILKLAQVTDRLGPMILGTSSQRSRRVANHGMTDQDAATSKAREAYLQKTMETLTFSPGTAESVPLATPHLRLHQALPQMVLPKRSVHALSEEQGLGFGRIGNDVLPLPGQNASRASASSDLLPPDNWRFTLPSSVGSPRPPSRLPTAGTSTSLGILGVSSYYCMTESELGLGQSGASVRGPSRLGQTQQSVLENDLARSPFAFSMPPLPDIPSSTVSRPYTAASLSPADSVSRPGSASVSPHRIRRKPVPQLAFENFVNGEEIKPSCKDILPVKSHTVPRSQRPPTVYIDKRASRSVPAFTVLSPKTSTDSAPSESRSTAMKTAIEGLKSFGARYRTRSFGKRGEADNSLSTICTGETILTPRESYEGIMDVPVKRVERDFGSTAASKVDLAMPGYTTLRQRQEAERMSAEAVAEKKTKGRLAKFFFH